MSKIEKYNGINEAFVKNFKRHYVCIKEVPNALAGLAVIEA